MHGAPAFRRRPVIPTERTDDPAEADPDRRSRAGQAAAAHAARRRHPSGRCGAGDPRRADARRQRAAQPGHVRHDVDGAAGARADGAHARQEHDRQGRVPADRGARDALREHPLRPLARPEGGRRHRLLDDRLERGGDARRPGAEAPLAARARRGGQARRQAEHRHGHQRPGLLGEVRELLGRRDAARPHGGRPLHAERRGGGGALRREHDRRRRHPRLDVRRRVRAGRRDRRRARRPPGAHRPRHPAARRRRVRRVRRAVHRPGPRMGLPPAARARRSTRRATSTGSSTRASAGRSGATQRRSPRI